MSEQDAVDRIVAQWAAERPDLGTAPMALFGRVLRLARLVGDEMERVYAPFGIGRPDFDVLATLRRSGPPYALSPGALAASMMISSEGTTARLDRLERAGLVARSPHPRDRRALQVRLTERAHALVDGAVEAQLVRQDELLAGLPPDQRERLDGLLRSLLASLGE